MTKMHQHNWSFQSMSSLHLGCEPVNHFILPITSSSFSQQRWLQCQEFSVFDADKLRPNFIGLGKQSKVSKSRVVRLLLLSWRILRFFVFFDKGSIDAVTFCLLFWMSVVLLMLEQKTPVGKWDMELLWRDNSCRLVAPAKVSLATTDIRLFPRFKDKHFDKALKIPAGRWVIKLLFKNNVSRLLSPVNAIFSIIDIWLLLRSR